MHDGIVWVQLSFVHNTYIKVDNHGIKVDMARPFGIHCFVSCKRKRDALWYSLGANIYALPLAPPYILHSAVNNMCLNYNLFSEGPTRRRQEVRGHQAKAAQRYLRVTQHSSTNDRCEQPVT